MKIKEIMLLRPSVFLVWLLFVMVSFALFAFNFFGYMHKDTYIIVQGIVGLSTTVYWAYYLIRTDQEIFKLCTAEEKEILKKSFKFNAMYWAGLALFAAIAGYQLANLSNFINGI